MVNREIGYHTLIQLKYVKFWEIRSRHFYWFGCRKFKLTSVRQFYRYLFTSGNFFIQNNSNKSLWLMTTIDDTKIVTKSNILSQHLLAQSQQWKQQNNWHRFGVFVNFEQISLKFLVFPLLTLNNLLLVGILFLISKKVSLVFVQNPQSNMTLISLDFYVQLANWKIWKHWNLWFF